MSFRLKLLGTFTLESLATAVPVARLDRKTRAILAYLAATGQRHSRQTLSEWFCQDAKDPAGTLRWHLSQIRRKVSADLLHVTRQTAVINPNLIQCDHHQFQTVLDNLATNEAEALAQAIALYQGPFLADLSLKNAPEFELWQMGERSRLQRLYEKGAAALITRRIRQAQFDAAIPVARRLLQNNPLLETAHAHLIWLYAQTGQREAALRQVEQCRALLRQELAVEPMAEITALEEAITQNQSLPPILPETQPEPMTLKAEPTEFIGRSHELAQLQTLWENGRAAALVDGPAGSGKTRLVLEFSRHLPAEAQLIVPLLRNHRHDSLSSLAGGARTTTAPTGCGGCGPNGSILAAAVGGTTAGIGEHGHFDDGRCVRSQCGRFPQPAAALPGHRSPSHRAGQSPTLPHSG